MSHTPSSRIIVIMSLLVALAAIAVNANWGSGFGFSMFTANNAAGSPENAAQPAASMIGALAEPPAAAMTTPLNAITSFDASLVTRFVIGAPTPPAHISTNEHRVAADASGNCAVNSTDSAQITLYVLGLTTGTMGTTLTPPGPCGALPITTNVVRGDPSGAAPIITAGSGSASVSLPAMFATPGLIIVPITVSDLTGLGVVSYDMQVTFDPAVITPASPAFSQTGTLSSSMSIGSNTANSGHLIIAASAISALSGSGTLLDLRFNVVGTNGQSTALTFADYTDPLPRDHQGCLFNEGLPDCSLTNGSVTIGTPTPTNTPTDMPTNTPTTTATGTATATNTPTPIQPPSLGNYPDSALVLSGNTTITPDAPPTNTTSITVQTSTGFVGGQLTADPLTGVVRVTNARHANIPPGSYTVTVRAFGPGGTATRTFMLTVTSGTVCSKNAVFNPPPEPEVLVGYLPRSIAIGDFNNDGKQDFVTTNDHLSIRLGDGTGGFTAAPDVTVGNGPISVTVADFNGDGNQDLVTGNAGGSISICLGNGMGGFTVTNIPIGPGAIGYAAIGDFNEDGIPDLAFSSVGIRLGVGDGTFISAPNVPVPPGGSTWIAIGDFNGDDNQDFAAAIGNVSIRLGNGSGGFTPPAIPEIMIPGGTSESLALGDFDNDGNQDFITGNYSGSSMSIRLGDGSAGFTSPAVPEMPVDGPHGVAIGDFDRDGKQDFITNNGAAHAIRLGDGSGGFTSPIISEYPAPADGPWAVAVGDFNGDGMQDFAATSAGNAFNFAVSIRLGACSWIIGGTVTYGNAIGSPAPPRFVQNVLVSGAGTPSASDTTGTLGTYTLYEFGAGSYTVTPTKPGGSNPAINSFDAARIAQHAAGITLLTGNQLAAADVSGNNQIQSFDASRIAQYVVSLPSPTPPQMNLSGTWRFYTNPVVPFPPLPPSESRNYASVTSNLTGEDYTAILLGDVSGNWNPASHARPVGSRQLAVGSRQLAGPERGIDVQLPQVVTASDKEIIIPVSVQGAADKGIISYEFDLRYDPAVIQPLAEPVDVAGTVSRGLSVVVNPYEQGLLRVVVYGAMPIVENGVLLNLRFTSVGKPGSISPLTWERILFNEGEPQVMVSEGRVEISY